MMVDFFSPSAISTSFLIKKNVFKEFNKKNQHSFSPVLCLSQLDFLWPFRKLATSKVFSQIVLIVKDKKPFTMVSYYGHCDL